MFYQLQSDQNRTIAGVVRLYRKITELLPDEDTKEPKKEAVAEEDTE